VITYQLEHFDDCYPEAQELHLLEQHWEEVALHKNEIPLRGDEDAYREMDANGALQIVTVREDGKLVGYKIHLIKTHLHYCTTLMAFSDMYYLTPSVRVKPRIAHRMFKVAEEELFKRGVVKVIETTKIHASQQRFLEFEGYEPAELVLTKILKG
jgi:hypothetical protein